MAKFTGVNQTLAFNSGTSGTNFCITGIDYSFDVDTYKAACAGGAHKATVAGQNDTTATVSMLIDKAAIDNVFGTTSGTFKRGATSTWTHNPEGTGGGNPTITSTEATVGSTSLSVPVEGLVSASVTIHFNNVTIAAL